MRDEKHLLKIAKKMAKLEKRLDYGNIEDVSMIEAQIEELATTLSPDELLAVDEIIISHHLIN